MTVILRCQQCGQDYRGSNEAAPCSHCITNAAVKMRGLGDAVANAIKLVTLGKVKPCGGCKERQAKLNALVPFRDA